MNLLYVQLEKEGETLHLSLSTEEPENTTFTIFVRAIEWPNAYPGSSAVSALANIDDTRAELEMLARAVFSMGIAHHRAHPEDQLEFDV